VFEFDPERVARLEAAGWRAYYDRRWLKLLHLVASLNREQFHIPGPLSYVAAYHVARASLAWAPVGIPSRSRDRLGIPVDHDLAAVYTHLVRFYRLARRYSGLGFDPARAAACELRYWVAHRRLVDDPDKSEFLEAMTALHSELFRLPPARLRASAEWRVAANNTVDGITSGRSVNPEADWLRIEDQLARCYRSIYVEVNGREPVARKPDYEFVTSWRIEAPVDRIFDVLRRPETWPGWWYGLEQVDVIEPGDDAGVGAVRRFVFRGQLPYRLRFFMRQTRQERPTLLEGQAWGELEGTGRWTLRPDGAATAVRYDWCVSPTPAWMRRLAPLARPAFVWNHDWVMRQGEIGLKRLLASGA
jgi:uncharacterized protein YndB with AHSA1/START domain